MILILNQWMTMVNHFPLFFFFLCLSLAAERIEIVAPWNINDIPVSWGLVREKGLQVFSAKVKNGEIASFFDDPQLKKVVFFNPFQGEIQSKVPMEKRVLFIWEPITTPEWYDALFPKIYTWNDDLVDNVRYFKFYYPNYLPMCEEVIPFEEKKFCVLVSGHVTPERGRLIEYFNTKPQGEFDFFGYNTNSVWNRLACYRGAIQGGVHWNEEKIKLLKNYKFCLCLENQADLRGYITEKIFGCFAAGCIPIYRGASNIESYIPKECLIDLREFQDIELLYRFLKEMSKEEYEKYLSQIRLFLDTDEAKRFSPENFDLTFFESVTTN